MKIQPYLFFNGTCEAAFRFYEKALGGKIGELHRFKDMPPQEGAANDGCGGMTPEALAAMGEKVMHVNLAVGDQMIMGSDSPGDSQNGIQGVTITLGFTDVEEGREVYEALSEKGEVQMPYGETFWANGFAMFKDQFGVPWMINAGDKPSP